MDKQNGESKGSEKWIEFEHYQYIARGGGEDRDPEIYDVCHRLRAKVVNPEPEKALEGKVHSWRYEDDGQYAIVDTRDGYLAIRMDFHVPQGRFRDYQFRSVVLEEPARPLAWEVYTRNEVDSWTPVEGQHLRPRSADGEQWLQEISRASDRLRERERDLTETRRILLEAVGHPLVENGSEPGKRVVSQLESKTDLKAADHALAAVKKEISRADELMRHLAGLRGTAVTLQQSAIEGRNLERIPTPVAKEKTAPTISAGHRLRV
ncbi:MAG TPA: hypothetical protein DCE44_15895 [Verrucomicrobiales bacterium]|nr:hypothetical protein [Verrucomicrobiales bacterium]